MKRFFLLILLLSSIFITRSISADVSQEQIIAGWLERVVLSPWQIKLKAKLDSGAKTSSIHAENIEHFEREGEPWVRFELEKGYEKNAIQHTIEAPLLREVQVKQHQLAPAIRPAIILDFCIDGYFYQAQFTLTDRTNFNYPVLLGRRFLKDNILIDSSEIFMHSKKNQAPCQMKKADDSLVESKAISLSLID